MMKGRRKVTKAITMDPVLVEQVKKIAEENGWNFSQTVGNALYGYFIFSKKFEEYNKKVLGLLEKNLQLSQTLMKDIEKIREEIIKLYKVTDERNSIRM